MIRLIALLICFASPTWAVDCADRGDFTVCSVDATTEDLRLFHANASGQIYGSFDAIEEDIGPLEFAMNAGMYHQDRSPVGLYLDHGRETNGLVTSEGPGNFGMLPNGVFCIGDRFARVFESLLYAAEEPDCAYATQSGPMLLIDGKLHPRFIADSPSRYFRNGVGVSEDGTTAHFVISRKPVNFWEFAEFFRDGLGVANALYFDGKVSRLYAPDIDRNDAGFQMGPIVGVVARQ